MLTSSSSASDGSSTFQVPEGSDDDATDDDMSSGSDVNAKNINGHGRKPQNSSANTTANAQVIDLTGGLGGRQTRQVIDLSSPCGSPIRIADDDETSNDLADAPVPADFEVNEPLVPENFEDGADQEELDDLRMYDSGEKEYGDDGIGNLGTAVDHDSPIDSLDDESDSMLDGYDDDQSDEDENSLGDLDDVEDTDDMDSEEDYLSDDVYGIGIDSTGSENPLPCAKTAADPLSQTTVMTVGATRRPLSPTSLKLCP